MSQGIYNHTYWDGMTTERHTSRLRRPSQHQPEPRPERCGPDTPLKEAFKVLAYQRNLRK